MFMAWWARVKRVYVFLLPIRFSFIALGVVAFAFLFSDQGHDIIAALTENDPRRISVSSHPIQRAFFVPLVTFLALQVWYWSRQLLRMRFADAPDAKEFPTLTKLTPRVLGAAAYVIMLAALYRVGRQYGRGGEQPLQTLWYLAILLAIGMVAFIAFCIGRRVVLEKQGDDVTDQKDVRDLGASTHLLLSVSIVVAVVFLIASTFFVQRTAIIGSMSIVLVSMALWVPFGSLLVVFGRKAKFPIFTAMLIYALAISPLADNHVVRTLSGTSQLLEGRPTVTATFDAWSARLAHDYPAEKTHPVFLVATEGGGIRAAYWTASVLTALDDDIPGFRDHLFAISGVSGGSVGTATYASLVTRQMDNPPAAPKLRPIAQQMLAYDSLAPTLSAMTQQDLLQRFIPAPLLPDRARALEEAWERGWRIANNGDDRVAHGLLALFRGRENRMPSVFLNGTTVETGSRLIASNCRITPAEFSNALDVFDAAGKDVRMSTAAHNSARFTYVSPAGTIRRNPAGNVAHSPLDCQPDRRCEHVIDGGYFDNSGGITAAEIANLIRRRALQTQISIQPYVLVIRYIELDPVPPASERFANESLSPVRGLANARAGRAVLAVAQLTPLTDAPAITFQLIQYPRTVPMPLGWLLSLHTRSAIDAQMGRDAKENGPQMKKIAELLNRPAVPDAIQETAAQAPAVMRIRTQ
jgi:hypothetical protein